MNAVIEETGGILKAEFSGRFSMPDLMESCEGMRAHKQNGGLKGYLLDFTLTQDSISILETKKFVKHLYDICGNTRQIAILRHGGAQEGEYLCSALARTMGLVVETFDFAENALAWINGKSVH